MSYMTKHPKRALWLKRAQLKVYPSGKAVVYFKRLKSLERPSPDVLTQDGEDNLLCVAAHGIEKTMEYLQGRGQTPSLDKGAKSDQESPGRHGLRGMTKKTQAHVRELLVTFERLVPKELTTFATVTLPDMGPKANQKLHQDWSKFQQIFLKELGREQARHGIEPLHVAVSEVQPKRFKRTGEPYLHLHLVFQGRLKGKTWALSTAWVRQLAARVIRHIVGIECNTAPVCRLEKVMKSVASYLSKYMSKGSEVVEEAIKEGYETWLPHQWFRSSRRLVQQARAWTHILTDEDYSFWQSAVDKDPGVWKAVFPVEIALDEKTSQIVAMAGYLTEKVQQALRVGIFSEGPRVH